MNFFKKIFSSFHVCSFNTSLASMYVSFNSRDVLKTCKCGKRKTVIEYRPNSEFSIPTNLLITKKEFDNL